MVDHVGPIANERRTPAEMILGLFANMVDALLIDSVVRLLKSSVLYARVDVSGIREKKVE